jgi:HD-like signal output (HDOD) protein
VSHAPNDTSFSPGNGAAAPAPLVTASLDDLIKSIRSVPVAPEILPRLQAKLLDVDTDISDLGALIKLDAGLASSVLKVSNSAYYSRGSEITSIEEAVSLIGYQETLRLVARCSYSTVMKGSLEFYGITGEQLWEEAVLSAFSMEHLCRAAGAEVSEGYIAGLLHAIGMVAINDFLHRAARNVPKAESAAIGVVVRWEKATLGWHHGEVGAAMMRQWRFAPPIAAAVGHQFDATISAEEPVLGCLLPLAVAMAAHVRRQIESQGVPVGELEFDAVRSERAGLSKQDVLDIATEVGSDWASMRRLLM